MPGPGSHLVHALGVGTALGALSQNGAWTCSHTLVLALNAFFGPDVGAFLQFLLRPVNEQLADFLMAAIHNPAGYVVLLGAPAAFTYSFVTHKLARYLDAPGWALSVRQTAMLAAAGPLMHYSLDVPFEENGKTPYQLHILATGWWADEHGGSVPTPPPVAVAIVASLAATLFFGFAAVHGAFHPLARSLPTALPFRAVVASALCARAPPASPRATVRAKRAASLIASAGIAYASYCWVMLYWFEGALGPPVGEEADLGVLLYVMLLILLPLGLCVASCHSTPGETGRVAAGSAQA
ncbi:unnamed protein product [Pedinophyceae sp. YPF-701]|nr:unnamed protein product [Pedinophyceae sp. YPF-701]